MGCAYMLRIWDQPTLVWILSVLGMMNHFEADHFEDLMVSSGAVDSKVLIMAIQFEYFFFWKRS